MKDWIGIILMFIGLILVAGGIIYGLWLLHPVLGIIAIGILVISIGRALEDI